MKEQQLKTIISLFSWVSIIGGGSSIIYFIADHSGVVSEVAPEISIKYSPNANAIYQTLILGGVICISIGILLAEVETNPKYFFLIKNLICR